MVGLDQQSAPKQLINEVPSHVVLNNNKVGASIPSFMPNMTGSLIIGSRGKIYSVTFVIIIRYDSCR